MFAAAGNHVEALHRSRFGPLELGDLAEGAWRLLTAEERAALG
jgi:16S rRNA pseudouridine516 synthase